jgi:hypothetical protein
VRDPNIAARRPDFQDVGCGLISAYISHRESRASDAVLSDARRISRNRGNRLRASSRVSVTLCGRGSPGRLGSVRTPCRQPLRSGLQAKAEAHYVNRSPRGNTTP